MSGQTLYTEPLQDEKLAIHPPVVILIRSPVNEDCGFRKLPTGQAVVEVAAHFATHGIAILLTTQSREPVTSVTSIQRQCGSK